MVILVGTYSRDTDSEGIYAVRYEQALNQFRTITVNQGIDNPSYLLRHPTLDVLYAVNEVTDFIKQSGAVSAFNVSDNGKLALLNQVPSHGEDPCHLAIDHAGERLLVSNYSSGILAMYSLQADGSIGQLINRIEHIGKSIDQQRQTQAHVHSAKFGDGEDTIYVADLGMDKLFCYPASADGSLTEQPTEIVNCAPGAGPRHLCFSPDFQTLYVIHELDNTIAVLAKNRQGGWTLLQTYSTLPASYTGASYCAEIQLSTDGRFLYGSNRGHDSIVVFQVLSEQRLKLIQHIHSGGKHPRHFSITPRQTNLLVANRDSNNVVMFDRDIETGLLTKTGAEHAVPAPVCITYF